MMGVPRLPAVRLDQSREGGQCGPAWGLPERVLRRTWEPAPRLPLPRPSGVSRIIWEEARGQGRGFPRSCWERTERHNLDLLEDLV